MRIRRPTERKGSHPGKKCVRGAGVLYCERKEVINITLTPTAINALTARALQEEISISETIERLARGTIAINQDAP